MRHQEHQIFLLSDLTYTAFPVCNIIFRHGKIVGKIKEPVHGILLFLRPFGTFDVLVDLFLIKAIPALVEVLHRVAFADGIDHAVKYFHGDMLRVCLVIGKAIACKIHDRSKHVFSHRANRWCSGNHSPVFCHMLFSELTYTDLRNSF